MTAEELRKLSVETSAIAIQNVSAIGHSGLVTLRMERGVVRRVWVGTPDGLLAWKDGRTIYHVLPNVEGLLLNRR